MKRNLSAAVTKFTLLS